MYHSRDDKLIAYEARIVPKFQLKKNKRLSLELLTHDPSYDTHSAISERAEVGLKSSSFVFWFHAPVFSKKEFGCDI